jgi:hypothetical protein
MTTPLSPAVQAVLDAMYGINMDFNDENSALAAAALRAAADRMMSLIGDIYHPKYLEGIKASADFLENIAAELEAQP